MRDVGQRSAIAGVVELVGQQHRPLSAQRRDPHAGTGEAVVDPNVLYGAGTRGRVPERATDRLKFSRLDGQGACGPLGAETGAGRGYGRGEHVAREGGEVVQDGEDTGDAADAAQEAGGEVMGDALEVGVGALVEFGRGAAGGDFGGQGPRRVESMPMGSQVRVVAGWSRSWPERYSARWPRTRAARSVYATASPGGRWSCSCSTPRRISSALVP